MKSAIDSIPNPEVQPRARCRRFTHSYKRCILQQVEAFEQSGGIEALLRREGLYSSHLSQWRWQQEKGALAERHPSDTSTPGDDKRVKQWMAELEQARNQLHQAQAVIAVPQKFSTLLSLPPENNGNKGQP